MGEPVTCDTSRWRRMDRTVCNRKPGCAPTGNRGYNIVSDGEGQCVAKALPRLPQRIVPFSSVLPEGTLHVSFGPFYNTPFTVRTVNSGRTKLAPCWSLSAAVITPPSLRSSAALGASQWPWGEEKQLYGVYVTPDWGHCNSDKNQTNLGTHGHQWSSDGYEPDRKKNNFSCASW